MTARTAAPSGSIYQRKDGCWCAALSYMGKRTVKYAASEREARSTLARLQRDFGHTASIPTPGRRTVADVLTLWLQSKRDTIRPRTLVDYETLISAYLIPQLGHIRLSRLEAAHVARALENVRRAGVVRRRQTAHGVLVRALDLAVRWEWIARNPARMVDRPAYAAPRKDTWTADELAHFLAAEPEHPRAPYWIVAAATGCRSAELLALHWMDLDLSQNVLHVRRSGQYIRNVWTEGEPKTRAGRRTLSLPPIAVAALHRQRAHVAAYRLAAGADWRDLGLVFPRRSGEPQNVVDVGKALRALCERAGVPVLTPHGFRHLSASLLFAAGLPVTDISARLGHANPGVTLTVYAHVIDRDGSRAADALEQVMGVRHAAV